MKKATSNNGVKMPIPVFGSYQETGLKEYDRILLQLAR